MKITCDNCDSAMQVPDDSKARRYKCPTCGSPVVVDRDEEPDEEDYRPRIKRKQIGSANAIQDVVFFRLMVTPFLIQFFFWVGVVVCICGGLMMIIQSLDVRGRTWEFLEGLFVMLFGPLYVRCICELCIIQFRIHSELKQMNDKK